MLLKKIIQAFLFILFALQFQAQSNGGVTTGAALYCDSVNSGFISLNGFSGQILKWQYSTDNGQSWLVLPNTTSTQSYNRLIKTTSFRAIVQDGTSLPDTSSASTVTVYVPGNAGQLSGGGHFCNEAVNGIITLTNAPGNVLYWQTSINDGQDWKKIANTSPSLNYSSITQNTHYRAIVETVAGCPDDTTMQAIIKIQPKTIPGSISNSDSLCYGAVGDTLRLLDYSGKIVNWYSSSDNGASWLIMPDTTSFITYSTVTETFWYQASVKNGICPTETTSPAVIALHNANPAEAGTDITITRHEKISLHGSGNGTATWNNPEYLSDPKSFNPIADPMNTTQYVLTLSDAYGCITKDSVTVNVIAPIPTAITPNGDGVNDYFEIDKINDYPQNSLMIFNRWGKKIYQASPYTNNWTGKSEQGHDLPDEQYYYVFDFGNGEKIITNYLLIKR